MAATVQQILQNKGGSTHSDTPATTVLEALKLMAERNVSAVLVTEGQRLVGIFTERDYARKVVLKGLGWLANALSGVNIRSGAAGAAQFNAVFDSRPGNYVERQAASDVTHQAAITVYDSIGTPISLTMTFTKDPTAPNRWLWDASVPAPAAITGGGSGFVTFDTDGRLETFAYNGGANSLQFDPGSGATAPVDLQLDSGVLGDINGLSQFASASNVVASSQDGYPMGNLQDISVDSRGVITGYFTNGVNQTLAQTGMESRVVKTRHHEAPLFLTESGGIMSAAIGPVVNHTDDELILLESYVGRVPDFMSDGTFTGPRY